MSRRRHKIFRRSITLPGPCHPSHASSLYSSSFHKAMGGLQTTVKADVLRGFFPSKKGKFSCFKLGIESRLAKKS